MSEGNFVPFSGLGFVLGPDDGASLVAVADAPGSSSRVDPVVIEDDREGGGGGDENQAKEEEVVDVDMGTGDDATAGTGEQACALEDDFDMQSEIELRVQLMEDYRVTAASWLQILEPEFPNAETRSAIDNFVILLTEVISDGEEACRAGQTSEQKMKALFEIREIQPDVSKTWQHLKNSVENLTEEPPEHDSEPPTKRYRKRSKGPPSE